MTSTGMKGSWLSQPTVKNLLVYRNGDPFFPGHRIVISEKKVSNFEVFLKEVTAGVKAPFGAVRNIYTPRGGHRVRQLEELRSGEQYVAGGREAFKKLNYLNIGETKKKPPEVNNEMDLMDFGATERLVEALVHVIGEFHGPQVQALLSSHERQRLLFYVNESKELGKIDRISTMEDVKPVTHSRITVSARFRKPLQEPYSIFLIANGDLISPVVRLLIPRKTLNHWDHILEMVTGKVTIRSGAVHRLYTVDGKLVQNGSDLENGQIYVAAGREKFKKLPYGDLLFRKSITRRPQGSKASALPPVVGSRKSKGSGSDRQSKSTTGSSDPGENSSSPQFPKRKDKSSHNPEDSVSRRDFSNNSTKVKQRVTASTGVLQDNGENIFEASGDGSEICGAAEVQEDEDTHVEVPLDQRPAETVDEEENVEEENDCGDEVYKGEEEYSEVNGEENEKAAEERSEVEENKKLNENYKDEAEETEADSDSQNQVDSHLEKTSTAPRVTITSPQESEKKKTRAMTTVA